MKKKIFKVALAAVIMGVGFFVWQSQRSEPLSKLALANVEALAIGEIDGFDKCESGCATDNIGAFCCTLTIDGVGFDLYYPPKREDK